MPKFEARANQGMLGGYRPHPGGRWARGYQVFPLTYFADYNFNTPRRLREHIPITTQKVKLTGGVAFPLKERYDANKRALLKCSISDASYDKADRCPDKDDTDDQHTRGRRTTAATRWRW